MCFGFFHQIICPFRSLNNFQLVEVSQKFSKPIHVSVTGCPILILMVTSPRDAELEIQIPTCQLALSPLYLVLLVVSLMDSGNCSPLPSSSYPSLHDSVLSGPNLWHLFILTKSFLLNVKGKYLVAIRILLKHVQRNPVTPSIIAEIQIYMSKRLS